VIGLVDHGKTALVRALIGTDTDRSETKRQRRNCPQILQRLEDLRRRLG